MWWLVLFWVMVYHCENSPCDYHSFDWYSVFLTDVHFFVMEYQVNFLHQKYKFKTKDKAQG